MGSLTLADWPKKILIIKPSALGDIVPAVPAMVAMKRCWPEARISWLVRPEYAELLRGHPALDEIIEFDRRLLGRSWCSPKAFGELLRLFRRLREGRFDIVFDFQGLFRTGFFSWVSGCRKRFGMRGAREFAGVFYTERVAQDKSCIHLVDYYLRMVEAAGGRERKVEFNLPEDKAAGERVKTLLKSEGVDSDNYIVLVPGAARAEKRWSIERFAELAERIAAKYAWSIVATGTHSEQEYVEQLRVGGKASVVNLAGRTSVKEVVELLRRASVVISNDTGPGHIAAAMGVPIVMIFGPTNPSRVCPYGRPECVAAVEPDDRGMKADSYDKKHDIADITVGQVFEKVLQQVSKKDS